MGTFGALGMAAWFGIPMVSFFPRMRAGFVSPVEIALIAMIVGFALFGAWRFHRHRGWIIGPILMVVLVIEVAKRIYMTFDGVISIGVFGGVASVMIFFGLRNGVRGARALRALSPDRAEVFE